MQLHTGCQTFNGVSFQKKDMLLLRVCLQITATRPLGSGDDNCVHLKKKFFKAKAQIRVNKS